MSACREWMRESVGNLFSVPYVSLGDAKAQIQKPALRLHIPRRSPVFAVFAANECICLIVADDLFLMRIERQGAA